MNTNLDSAIREHIYQYLAGAIDLRTFEEWFVGETWDVIGVARAPLADLIGAVELALAEFSSGQADIEELREDFRRALHTIIIGEMPITSGSSATFIEETLTAGALAGISAGMTLASVAVSS
jgi:hypothetical protein